MCFGERGPRGECRRQECRAEKSNTFGTGGAIPVGCERGAARPVQGQCRLWLAQQDGPDIGDSSVNGVQWYFQRRFDSRQVRTSPPFGLQTSDSDLPSRGKNIFFIKKAPSWRARDSLTACRSVIAAFMIPCLVCTLPRIRPAPCLHPFTPEIRG